MHNPLKTIAILLSATALVFSSCKKDDPDIDPPVVDEITNYSGSGSEGDLITFDINQTDQTYTINNETTGQEDEGRYEVMDTPGLEGIYSVTIGSDEFYAVELDDKIIAANFPTGNPLNTISFGVSSALDNSGNTNNIAGDYTFIIMDNEGIMGDPSIKEWGVISINSNGTWIKQSFASNTGDGSIPEMNPESYSGQLPLSTGDGSGSWAVNGTNKERLDVTIDGTSDALSGYVYADANEAAFLLDLGTGNGFLIGLKITDNSSFSSITGDYKFVNVWDNGFGAGNYSISSSGDVDWVHQGSDGPSSGTFELTKCGNAFSNVYYSPSVQLEDTYFEKLYCVIVGDIIIHFGFDNSNGDFAQYGIGARID